MAKTTLNTSVDDYFKSIRGMADINITRIKQYIKDIYATNDYGSLLHAIVNYRYKEEYVLKTLEVLLPYLDSNYRAKSTGYTFIHLAIYGYTAEDGKTYYYSSDFLFELISLARQHNFDVNTVDNDKDTALHALFAAEAEEPKDKNFGFCISAILNAFGNSIDLSLKNSKEEIVEDLIEKCRIGKGDSSFINGKVKEEFSAIQEWLELVVENKKEEIKTNLKTNLEKLNLNIKNYKVKIFEEALKEVDDFITLYNEIKKRAMNLYGEEKLPPIFDETESNITSKIGILLTLLAQNRTLTRLASLSDLCKKAEFYKSTNSDITYFDELSNRIREAALSNIDDIKKELNKMPDCPTNKKFKEGLDNLKDTLAKKIAKIKEILEDIETYRSLLNELGQGSKDASEKADNSIDYNSSSLGQLDQIIASKSAISGLLHSDTSKALNNVSVDKITYLEVKRILKLISELHNSEEVQALLGYMNKFNCFKEKEAEYLGIVEKYKKIRELLGEENTSLEDTLNLDNLTIKDFNAIIVEANNTYKDLCIRWSTRFESDIKAMYQAALKAGVNSPLLEVLHTYFNPKQDKPQRGKK